MAGSSLLALIDDIATLLDDVALFSKVAAKKTASVLGDDLALNAEQVGGIRAERELPVVWAVAKGSLVNKLILVPAALLISAFAPWLVTPMLMLGGTYLCFEGAEKLLHSASETPEADRLQHQQVFEAASNSQIDMLSFEKQKIKGAIRTDFVLSAEIIVIALGTVSQQSLAVQSMVVAGVALIITFGVYGLVAAIVKLDDIGLYLLQLKGDGRWRNYQRRLGRALLSFAPWLMKTLGIVGTLAMFLVGGGILLHGLPGFSHWLEPWLDAVHAWPVIGGFIKSLISISIDIVAGVLAGLIAVMLLTPILKLRQTSN